MRVHRGFIFAGLIVLVLCVVGWAEDGGGAAAGSVAPQNFVASHVKFVSADVYSRYRYVDKGEGKVTDRDVQYKVSTRLQVNLVGDGTTYVQVRGESGRSFTSSWDYTGIGDNRAYWSFNLKSLYLGQKIGKFLEAQAGGIEYDWGAGTEATYADNDGWLEGYRLRYSGISKGWRPDKVSVTVGYVGDFNRPNIFERLHRMGDENYIQVLGSRKFGKTRELSAEFDSIQGIRYTREALRLQKLPLVVIDDISVEAIARLSDIDRFGWSASLSKTLDRKGRVRPGVFYSDIPAPMFLKGKQTIFSNGDSYALGKRVGPMLRVIPFKNFEVTFFGSRRLDGTPGPRYRGQVQFRYQLASLLNYLVQ